MSDSDDSREPPDPASATGPRPSPDPFFITLSTDSGVSPDLASSPIPVSSTSPDVETPAPFSESDSSDYQTLSNGVLNPRHRRLCQLAAAGSSNAAIAEELGYVGSRVSILLKNQYIAAEILRLQDRIFEETIKGRLKQFAEPALNNIHRILTDNTNRVKTSEKADMSKWVVEKLDGKATQTNDIGENMLSVLLDRLDARRTHAQIEPREVGHPDLETKAIEAPKKVELSDEEIWAKDFCAES